MLIQLCIFDLKDNLSEDNEKYIKMLGSNVFKPLIHMIKPELPYSYTHSLRVLSLHISPNTYLWPCAFMFHEFSVKETSTLTLKWYNLEIHIGEDFLWDTYSLY